MRGQLTTTFVESVKPLLSVQKEYWDGKFPGFGLRVSPGGRKAWVLMYRHQGHLKRLTLGTYPTLSLAAAREAARNNLALVQGGKDPAFEKQDARDADNFNTLADRYLSEHAARHKKASSAHEDEKMLRRELRPFWGNRKVRDIKRQDVIAVVDNIAQRGAPISANRVLSLASKIFNFAVSKSVIEVNPAYRIPKPAKEQAHDRVLTDEEIIAVWEAADQESTTLSTLFRVLLLTGQRRGEVVGMSWSEVDLDAGWWVIPKERTKNSRLHRVPLVGQALEILKQRKAQNDGSFVFPGPRRDRPLVNVHKALHRIIERSGVTPFTIHDLRRTCGTGMAAEKVPQIVISKVLNHITMETGGSRITLVYDRHTYDEEKRQALTKWDEHVRALLNLPASQNVA